MVKCRRVTIKKHGSGKNFSYTVNLAGKAMMEVGTKSMAKEYAVGLKISEKSHCGRKLTRKERLHK